MSAARGRSSFATSTLTPHNTGYSYSLTDPTNLGTKTYAALDTFVQQGGGWTALCHSILSNENNIANLTLFGSVANIIVMEGAGPRGNIGFLRFLRYGAIVTIVELVLAFGILAGERALGIPRLLGL